MKKAIYTTALFSLLLLCGGVVRGQEAFTSNHSKNEKTSYMPVFPNGSIKFNIAMPVSCYSIDPIPDYLGCVITESIAGPNAIIIVQDKEYKVFEHFFDIYVREDTLTGRIYRYYPELDTEVVVCDMSLSVGDTFRMPDVMDRVQNGPGSDYWDYYYHETNKPTVVDSVVYVGGRKIIFLKPFGFYADPDGSLYFGSEMFQDIYPNLRFIEGVGPTYGPFGYINRGAGYMNLLLCVHYGDSLVYMNHPILGCYQFGTGVFEYPASTMRLYPNPASQMLNVEFDGKEPPLGVITVTDMAGVVVLSQECSSAVTSLDVSRLKSGVYVIGFRNDKGYIVKKFVKM